MVSLTFRKPCDGNRCYRVLYPLLYMSTHTPRKFMKHGHYYFKEVLDHTTGRMTVTGYKVPLNLTGFQNCVRSKRANCTLWLECNTLLKQSNNYLWHMRLVFGPPSKHYIIMQRTRCNLRTFSFSLFSRVKWTYVALLSCCVHCRG